MLAQKKVTVRVWAPPKPEGEEDYQGHVVISLERTRGGKSQRVSVGVSDRDAVVKYFAEHHEYCPCFGLQSVPDDVKKAYAEVTGVRKLVEEA